LSVVGSKITYDNIHLYLPPSLMIIVSHCRVQSYTVMVSWYI